MLFMSSSDIAKGAYMHTGDIREHGCKIELIDIIYIYL